MPTKYKFQFKIFRLFNPLLDDLKFWKRKERESDKNNPWTKVPNSLNIEMTSYALLSYVKRGLYEDAIPILNWLITQQNDQGGFASTQVNRISCFFIFFSFNDFSFLFLFLIGYRSSYLFVI